MTPKTPPDHVSISGDGLHLRLDAGAWTWTSPAGRILEAVRLGASADVVVLVEEGGEGRRQGRVMRVDQRGGVRWTRSGDGSQGSSFTAVRVTHEGIAANTWGGWLVTLDPDTGAVVDREFVK